MNSAHSILLASFLSLVTTKAFAQAPSFEVMCRQKAKEIAAETYRGCVTENKKTQIEQLRNDYQSRLKALKDEYETEIQRLSASKRTGDSAAVKPDKSENRTEKNDLSQALPAPRAMNQGRPNTIGTAKKTARNQPRANAVRAYPSKSRKTGQATTTEVVSDEEMTVELRPAERDESSMDIPEPIPVEGQSQIESQI